MRNVIHIITALNNGGAEAVLYRLATNDNSNQHMIVSLMDMGRYGPMLEKAGIEVVCLNMPKGRITLSGVIRLWRLLRQKKPNIVQTWMYHGDLVGGIVARLAGVKGVFWNIRHTTLEPGQSKDTTILVAKICARLSGFVPQKIICCAEKAAEVHAALGYKKSKMQVIGNGYRLSELKPNEQWAAEVRNELGLADTPVIGMVGRFNECKDHKNLIASLAILQKKEVDFRCLLVGPEVDNENCQLVGWLHDLGLQGKVFLLGQRKDISAIMNALDVHVLSSSSEAFPNVLAEAMACGTPCVATDVGDANLIVGDTGWIVPSKNPQALAQSVLSALQEMHADPCLWNERQQACRMRIVENFSIERMVDAYQRAWLF